MFKIRLTLAIAAVFFASVAVCRAESAAPPKQSLVRLADSLKPAPNIVPFADGKFSIRPDEVVVFTGPENVVLEQRTGWIETHLAAAFKEQMPRFRHMGWEGDTVYRQNRMDNHGTWKDNFDAVDATMVFVWFGQNEAFDSSKTVDDFAAAYAHLLDVAAQRTPRIVVISPTPFEQPASAYVADNTSRNAVVKQHADAARKLAQERGYVFVDLFTPLAGRAADAPKLTRDGLHFTPEAMPEIAALVVKALGIGEMALPDETLRLEILEKNRIWFDTWRCMNWAFAFGDRTTQPFAQATPKYPPFVKELTHFLPLIARADARVHALASGKEPPATLPPEGPPEAPDAQTSDQEKESFTLYPGLEVNLLADEKLGIVKPIQIRWDERGRLWVLCIPSYPQLMPGQKANDYLLVLESTHNDGKFDKATRFAEGLFMPMGFEFGDGGVYICESTQLTHWRDTKGSGKADMRRVVLSGFGTGDSHQMINSISWQPDGCLWFTQGYHIWSYVETPYGISELARSGVWRFNPRTLKLDGFFNESSAGLNAHGVTFDDYGQVFQGCGASYCLFYSTPGLIPTLHPLLYRDTFCRSKGKSMEPEFISSRHLLDDLQGVLLKSTYFTSQVSLYRLSDDGAGFKSDALPDLIASKNSFFRPVETRVGPDGALYVCDWLNSIIGHYQASYRDPRRDRSHGRIWRITATGRPLLEPPALEKMNAPELLDQLRSPERWVRDQSRRLLYGMPKEAVLSAADAWVAKLDAKDPQTGKLLYNVSGVYCAHEAPRPELVERLLASSDFRLRAWGTRLVGYWVKGLPNALVYLNLSIKDVHPRVRMEAVVAASYFGTPEAMKVATLALDMPLDYFLNYALTQCIFALAPAWQPALLNGTLDFGERTHALTHVLRTVGGQASLKQIRQLVALAKLSTDVRVALVCILVEAGDSKDLDFALEQAASSPRVLKELANAAHIRKIKPTGDLNVTLEKLMGDKSDAVRAAAFRLAAAWQIKAQLPRAQASASDIKCAPSERAAAIEAIAALSSMDKAGGVDPAALLTKLTHAEDAEVRRAALTELAPLDTAAAAARAAELLADVQKPEEAGPLLLPFLIQNSGASVLAKAISEKKPGNAGANAALQWMAQSGHDDVSLQDALNAAAGIEGQHREYSPELVAKCVADAKTIGDAKRGESIFHMKEYACLNCHKVGNEGATIGPELTSVSRGLSEDLIVEAVLWPKRQVKEGFMLTQIIMKDGRRFQGFKAFENDKILSLRDIAGGTQTYEKTAIKKRNDAGTIMPDGIVDRASRQQLADLLRFLMELGK